MTTVQTSSRAARRELLCCVPGAIALVSTLSLLVPACGNARAADKTSREEARVALGQKLFFDQRLSADGSVSCASCHDPLRGFADQRPLAAGIRGMNGPRNTPTVTNVALLNSLFWDGRATSLEDQALLPIVNPIEMGHENGAAAIAAIEDDPSYRPLFEAAFRRRPNYEDVGRAIAAYERTLVFLDAPFDRFLGGKTDALSSSAKLGWRLFNGKAGCASCHSLNPKEPLGTDGQFHNVGVSARKAEFSELAARAVVAESLKPTVELAALGRFLVTRTPADIGAFRTAPLRNLSLTAPYMHDGSLATLRDVLEHYNQGGVAHAFLDSRIKPLGLTEQELSALHDFLLALTDNRLIPNP